MKHAYIFEYPQQGLANWPRDISLRHFIDFGTRIIAVVESYDKVEPDHTRVHINGEERLYSIAEIRKRDNLERTLSGGNIHFSTNDLSCSLQIKKGGYTMGDAFSLWGSGLVLAEGANLLYNAETLTENVIAIPCLLLGTIGSLYAWREQRKAIIGHLELKVFTKHTRDLRKFEELRRKLKTLQA